MKRKVEKIELKRKTKEGMRMIRTTNIMSRDIKNDRQSAVELSINHKK